jgi:hypothetical protein
MPRRSADDLTTRRPAPKPAAPIAPAGLNLPERRLWDAVVAAKPAGWFDAGTLPLLRGYVQAAALCDVLAAKLTPLPEDMTELRRLLDMRDRESRRAAMLATKLRLTQQSRYRPETAARRADGPPAGAPRPWQRDGA